MDATTSGTPTIQYHNIPDQPITTIVATQLPTFQRQLRHCFGDSSPGEFPLSANPSIVLHVLTSCSLYPQDLAKLEATCSFFKKPANFAPDFDLSLSELAALDMCQKRAIFKPMTTEQQQDLKQRCGGSWKLVLRFLMAGEACCRREKSQAIAGPGHSIAVTSKGVVYSFGSNSSGQLGHGTTKEEWQPRPIRALQGIRIIQATVATGRTMLISDFGQVYAFGKDSFGEAENGIQGSKMVTAPQLVESLKNIFVVQAAIGNFFTAVLSREGRVYTFSWGSDGKLCHHTDPNDVEPRPLLGALEHMPVVQIAAGFCYLLCLVCQPSGMSGETEAAEVAEILAEYGIQPHEYAPVVNALRKNPQAWLDFMMKFELGLEKPDPRRALHSAMTIAIAYILGGVVPLLPYVFIPRASEAVVFSVVVTLFALLVFGYAKGHFTGNKPFRSALETALIGAIASAAAFGLAKAFHP